MRAVALMGLSFVFSTAASAQENEKSPPEQDTVEAAEAPGFPGFKLLRAEEDYSYLREADDEDFFTPIKRVELGDPARYLTIGGEIRTRFEAFENRDWEDNSERFYSQRLALHTSLGLGSHVRLFGEIYHGLLSKEEKEITQDDELDLHQGFVQITLPAGPSRRIELRVGRQELSYGSARLVGIREGPNIRRAFDSARISYSELRFSVEAGVGREVSVPTGFFDNRRNDNLLLWNVFVRVPVLRPLPGATELYYFGFDSKRSRFDAGVAAETRHTIGVRRFGSLGANFRFNTELMFQFGEFGDKGIRAFAIETDYRYLLDDLPLRPVLGVKLDYVSGDGDRDDDRLGTFNPMFPNPSYFGLLGQITPMNMVDVHPWVVLELSDRTELLLEWDLMWRASKEDGLYGPPRFLTREGGDAESRSIGHQLGAELVLRLGRHLTWSSELSYFLAGDFIRETGESENIFHFASTLSFRF
jgi:hypothetical protein